MFNLPLVVPPLSQAAADAEVYDMPYIARRLAEVMDEASIEHACFLIDDVYSMAVDWHCMYILWQCD